MCISVATHTPRTTTRMEGICVHQTSFMADQRERPTLMASGKLLWTSQTSTMLKVSFSESSMSSVEKYQFQGLELVMSAIHRPRDLSSACIQVREGQLRGYTGLKLVIERQLQFWRYPYSLQGHHAATWIPTSPLSVFRSTTLSGCWPTPMRRASTSIASSSRWLAPATSLHFTPSPTLHLHPFILHPPPSLEPPPHPAPTIMEQPLWHLGESRDSKGLGSF